LGHGIRIDGSGRVEDDSRRKGLRKGLHVGIALTRHFLKHTLDHTDMEMNVLLQAGAKAVNEGNCADVQGLLFRIYRTRAVGLQALCNDWQKNTQHHVERFTIALHEVAKAFGNRQHPLAHRQAGEQHAASRAPPSNRSSTVRPLCRVPCPATALSMRQWGSNCLTASTDGLATAHRQAAPR
jgi:hypothetical protein